MATFWIRQTIQREISGRSRTIRLPEAVLEKRKNIEKARRRLTQALNRNPTMTELAKASDLNLKEVEEVVLLDYQQNLLSLNQPPRRNPDGETLGNTIEDKNVPPIDKEETEHLIQKDIAIILDNLPEREKQVVEMIFGLNGCDQHSLQVIGEHLGVSYTTVINIKKKSSESIIYSRC